MVRSSTSSGVDRSHSLFSGFCTLDWPEAEISEHELCVYIYTMLESPRKQSWAIYRSGNGGKNGGKLNWKSDELVQKGDYLLVSEDGE